MSMRDLRPDEVEKVKSLGFDPANTVIDENGDLYDKYPAEPPSEESWGDIAGRIGRQAAFAAPSAVAGRLGAAGLGAALGTPLGPPGQLAGAIAGGIGGPLLLRKYVQTPIENFIAERFPSSALAGQIEQSRKDQAEHPYQSLGGELLTAPLAGGSYKIFEALKQGGKRLAAQAGILTGVDAAAQKASTGEVDPLRAGLAGLGGALTAAPSSAFRSFERGAFKFLPENVLNAVAPNVPMRQSALQPTAPPSRFPHEAPDYNPDFLLGTDVGNLQKLGKFEQSIANLRKQNIPLSPEDLQTLSREGATQGWDRAVESITRRKLPMMEGQAPPDARVKQQMEMNFSPGKQATITGDVLKEVDAATSERLAKANEVNTKQLQNIQNAQANQAAAEGLANYPTSGKNATESAQTIMGRGAQVKSVNSELQGLAKEASTINKLRAYIESLPEDTKDLQDLHSMLAEMEGLHNTKRIDVLKRSESLLPGGKGLQEFPVDSPVLDPVEAVPAAAKVSPEPAAQRPVAQQPKPSARQQPDKPSPIPESRATVEEQLKLFREGKKQAVLLPPGTPLPKLQSGELTTVTGKGTFVHKNDLPSKEIVLAARQNRVGDILGYGTPDIPPGATEAITLNKPSGTPVQEVLATPATAPEVLKAAKAVAKPGDTIEVKPATEVLQKRLETPQVVKGDIINRNGIDYVVDQIGMRGLISARSSKGHVMNIRTEDLNRDLTAGRAEIIPANSAENTSVVLTAMEADSPVGRLARLAVREDPAWYETMKEAMLNGQQMDEGGYFKTLPPEKQAEITKRYLAQLTAEPSKPPKGMKIRTASREGGFTLNPAKIVMDKIKPDLEKLRENFGKLGTRFAKRAEQMAIERQQIEGPLNDHLLSAERGLSQAELDKIHDYLYDISDKGTSDIVLTPDQLARARRLQEIRDETGAQKQDGPWVTDFDNEGNAVQRPVELRPGWMPQELKKNLREKLRSGKDADIESIKEPLVRWIMDKKGVSREAAEKMFNAKYRGGSFTTRTPLSPEFQSMRFAEGVGLPPELRENIFEAMKHYINRHATDLAYHKTMERDPVIGKALGLEDNGRGEAYPDLPDGENVGRGDLLNGLTKSVFRDYVGIVSPEAQAFERWNRLANTMFIQTVSQARDIIMSHHILQEVISPTEQHYVLKGLAELFKPETRQNAIRAGALRSERNIAQTTAIDAEDAINRITDVLQKGTGAEALNTAHRKFNYIVGKRIAEKRLLQNDSAFFDKWGPHAWHEWPADKLTDYVAARITQNVIGSSDFQGLPAWLGKGSQSGFKPMFSLMRWSTERFNRWRQNTLEPAKQGNIVPLIASLTSAVLSAEGFNWLAEKILKRKPRELTMEEYLNLGGKDTANTLFSKLSAAGYAGILSDLAMMGVQMSNGEMPRGFNNMLFVGAENLTTRLSQWADALHEGTAGLEDLPLIVGLALRDNMQIVRAFTPIEDTTNMREERLAARLGYTPRQGGLMNFPMSSPFSVSQVYKRGDIDRLGNMIVQRAIEGREDPIPSTALKDPGVYKFIYDARGGGDKGKAAAKKAIEADFNQDLKNEMTYAEALRKRMNR